MIPRIHFVVNPQASNRKCGRVWARTIAPALEAQGIAYAVHRTHAPGEATHLVHDLCDEAETVVSVGGDGTHNEVVTGIAEAGLPARGAPLGFLTLGTGGDFRRTLGLPRAPMDQLQRLLDAVYAGRTRRIDLGRLSFVDHEGRSASRAFINIASFGIGGEVDDRVNRTTKLFGGFTSFLIGSLRAAGTYSNRHTRVTVDGEEILAGPTFNVAVANGRCFGGGMRVAPDAALDDGAFDVVAMGDLSLAESLRLMPRIYRGAHTGLPKVSVHRGTKVEAASEETVLLDVDGEQPGRLPATFELVPDAIEIFSA